VIGLAAGLILLQPDISASFMVILISFIMLFAAGINRRLVITFLLISVLIMVILIQVNSTAAMRMENFTRQVYDPTTAYYHIQRSLEALARGGLLGVGLGNSQTKVTGLPVPYSDSIFAVIVEELGLFGALFLIGLYTMLILVGVQISQRSSDWFGSLLTIGIIAWVGFNALINLGGISGLLPFAGNALPLISLGGSNLVSTLAGLGIVANISSQISINMDLPPSVSKIQEWFKKMLP
jgi:cell division protein FtsW